MAPRAGTGDAPGMATAAPRIAVVLPGGGTRGAYEAGALSVLLPVLKARGERIDIVCGTSVGAINAALLGSMAHLPHEQQAAAMVERWRSMRKGDVVERLVGPMAPLTLLRLLGETLEVPGVHLAGLMDPGPLKASLERWIDWPALHRNVAGGTVGSVCVVATSLERGAPVGFVESAARPPRSSDDVRYVAVQLRGEHVRASAAMPLLFPPVRVTHPRSAAGHYIDGGTRLNAPIAPAIALGAQRIIVVGFEPLIPAEPVVAPEAPRLADVAANVLDGLLVDQVADDVRRLMAINSFFVEGVGMGPAPGVRAYRAARGRAPYRRIACALISPERRGMLGELAEQVFKRRYGGLRGLRAPDFPLMARLLGGGRARSRGELLSFLLFDEVFVEELLAAGRSDAERWVERHPQLWCADPGHDTGFELPDAPAAAEAAVLDEYRALRRR
jgi:NTE family protein